MSGGYKKSKTIDHTKRIYWYLLSLVSLNDIKTICALSFFRRRPIWQNAEIHPGSKYIARPYFREQVVPHDRSSVILKITGGRLLVVVLHLRWLGDSNFEWTSSWKSNLNNLCQCSSQTLALQSSICPFPPCWLLYYLIFFPSKIRSNWIELQLELLQSGPLQLFSIQLHVDFKPVYCRAVTVSENICQFSSLTRTTLWLSLGAVGAYDGRQAPFRARIFWSTEWWLF